MLIIDNTLLFIYPSNGCWWRKEREKERIEERFSLRESESRID